MKHVLTTISAALLAGGLCAGTAGAMPRLDAGATAPMAAPATEQARLVCNYRRCYRVGYYRPYYRTYGYYRPYYYRPHLGIGIGPFGVGLY